MKIKKHNQSLKLYVPLEANFSTPGRACVELKFQIDLFDQIWHLDILYILLYIILSSSTTQIIVKNGKYYDIFIYLSIRSV